MATQMPQPATQPLLDGLMQDIERGVVKIPQFQRDFVWPRNKSADLIDSLLRGFPIGTFILWKTKEQLRTVRDIGDIELPETPEGDFTLYVLDGQQRLTSIFAAIKGAIVARDGKADNFAAIYVDLAADEDSNLIVTNIEGRKKWSYISVRNLLSYDFTELAEFPRKYHERMRAYRDAIKSYNSSTIVVQEASIDVATEIFKRINVTGVPLTVFEIMVAKTFDPRKNFDLAERVGDLLAQLSEVDFRTVRPIVVLQAISAIMAKDTRKKTILALDREQFINTWPKAKEGILLAVDYLRSSLRLPVSELLPYQSILVPLAYFFANHKDMPIGDMDARLKDLFWRTSLAGHYSQALDTKLAQDIGRVDSILKGRLPRYDYPVDPTPEFIVQNGYFSTGRAFIKAILCLFASRTPRRFDNHDSNIIVSNDWLKRANSKNYHHFFPKKVLGDEEWDTFYINHIANITIVDEYLNKSKIRARKPSDYMGEFKETNHKITETMKTHLISLGRNGGVWDDDYEKFFNYRSKKISKELKKRIIPQKLDTQGQTPNSDDLESSDIPE